MARTVKVVDETYCDWHTAIEAAPATASQTREATNPATGKEHELDLCALCAYIWQMVNDPEVKVRLAAVDRLFNIARVVGREPVRTPARVHRAINPENPANLPETPMQLALATAQPPADGPPQDATKKRTYVRCHDCQPSRRVLLAGRTSHARSVHKTEAHKIIWLLDDGSPLPFPCRVHDDCDQTSFAFPTPQIRGYHEKQSLPQASEPVGDDIRPRQRKSSAKSKSKSKRRTWTKQGPNGSWNDNIDQVGCPLPHPKQPDAPTPYWVQYSGRSSHSEMVHDGAKVWEIEWIIPESLKLRHPCTAHPECLRTHLAFKNITGLRIHTVAHGQPSSERQLTAVTG